MKSAVGSPLRSSSALVAMVVPIFTAAIALGGQRRAARDAEQIADAGERGVLVAPGVLGEQLVGDERAVGPARDDVGEGAAAVDPELPARRGVLGHGVYAEMVPAPDCACPRVALTGPDVRAQHDVRQRRTQGETMRIRGVPLSRSVRRRRLWRRASGADEVGHAHALQRDGIPHAERQALRRMTSSARPAASSTSRCTPTARSSSTRTCCARCPRDRSTSPSSCSGQFGNEDPVFAADNLPFVAAGWDNAWKFYQAQKPHLEKKLQGARHAAALLGRVAGAGHLHQESAEVGGRSQGHQVPHLQPADGAARGAARGEPDGDPGAGRSAGVRHRHDQRDDHLVGDRHLDQGLGVREELLRDERFSSRRTWWWSTSARSSGCPKRQEGACSRPRRTPRRAAGSSASSASRPPTRSSPRTA